MTSRRPKVVTTDFRPPTAGSQPPLERGNARPGAAASLQANAALDALAKLRAKEAAEHDSNVASYGIDLALAAFKDARRQKVSRPSNPEEYWWSARFGALARLILKHQSAAA